MEFVSFHLPHTPVQRGRRGRYKLTSRTSQLAWVLATFQILTAIRLNGSRYLFDDFSTLRLPVNNTAFHYESHLTQSLDLLRRIAFDRR
jgi:hypothetical protein